MAIVKTLIVKGVARFLTDAYMSTIRSGIWNGNTIGVGYGGTGVTSAKGDLYTPVFLSANGIAPCSAAIPHNTKDFKINGTTYSIFTTYTGTAPTIFAPTTLAGTGGYILATNAAKTGLEWVAKPATNVTTTAVVAAAADGTTQITAAQANPYYNLLEGGSVTRSIQFTSSNITISSTTAGAISFTAKSWAGATSSAAGTAGYMPGATSADRLKFLRGDGNWVTLSETDHTHSVIINGVEKIIAASGGTAVDLGSYLPLSGGIMTGDIQFNSPWNSSFTTLNTTDSSTNERHTKGLHFKGKSDGGWIFYRDIGADHGQMVLAMDDDQGEEIVFGHIFYDDKTKVNVKSYIRMTDGAFVGNVIGNASTATILQTSRTINGTSFNGSANITTSYWGSSRTLTIGNTGKSVNGSDNVSWSLAEIGVNTPIELVSTAQSLKVDTWTTMVAIDTLDIGTYAIQINSGNVYASGIFSACHGTDTVTDEIPLHVTDSGTNTWRPYARVSGTDLQMTTNEATGTSREYTIKILKLI